jgi:predicted DNA-binding transcriptional regulator YafY
MQRLRRRLNGSSIDATPPVATDFQNGCQGHNTARRRPPATTMPTIDHDTLAHRLMQLLIKLNQGERLEPQALAKEFGVTLRTIQRDLRERLAHLPLEKADGRYHLDPAWLGRLNLCDLERFASLAGVGGLFPSISDRFLRELFDSRQPSPLLVQGQHYEALSDRQPLFQQLEQAIRQRRRIGFVYSKPASAKPHIDVEPHKLANHGGIWYLAAVDAGKLKSFAFGKIDRLLVSDTGFEPDPAIEQRLLREDGIWLSEDKTRVVLKVAPEIAGYFKRRRLVPDQALEKELEDGSLVLTASMAHPNQILPIVRYWIPHVRIVSPPALRTEMEAQIRTYLTRN